MPGSPFVDILGPDRVLTEPDDIAPYCVDWSGRFRGATPAVLLPGTTEQVAAIVAACRDLGIGLTLQGGNTGLVGGSVPLDGEVVLSLSGLDHVGPVDDVAGQLTAGAGASLAAVQWAAGANAGAAPRWAYGVDFASRDRATVGGTIATNAGGLRVLRHGDTRAQVLGVEAVLGDGTVISHLDGLLKDNTGYHLPSLLCGSEGTLGVVTAARLRLVPAARLRVTALLAFDDVAAAVVAAHDLRRHVRALDAAELMLADGVDLVCRVMGLPPLTDHRHAAFVLVAAADTVDPTAELTAGIGALLDVAEVVLGGDALWAYREYHTASVNTLGPPHKLDVTLPADRLAPFVDQVPGVVAGLAPHGRSWMWGHAADGNVHVNVTGVEPDDDRVDDAVLRLAAGLGGSISAEHGIGTAKRRWLHLNRSQAEIDAFRAVKRALDPDGILNPNVLLPSNR